MSRKVSSYLISELRSHSSVDSEVLLTALFYVESSRGRFPGPELSGVDELLREEEFSEDALFEVKQALIALATKPDLHPKQFASCIRVLREFADPKLVPLLSTWLDAHLRKVMAHSVAVSELLYALTQSGAAVPHRQSSGTDTVELNIQTAKDYLGEFMGIRYAW